MREGIEDVVFGFMRFPSGLAAHLHLSWLDPHKERRFTVVGSRLMATFDDMDLERKLTVYDKGFDETRGSYGEYNACSRGCRRRSTARAESSMRPSDRAPGLVLGDGVELPDDARIGAHVVIHPGTVLGAGCDIQDGAVLGKPPKLARHSTARRDLGEPLVVEAGAVVCCGAVVV